MIKDEKINELTKELQQLERVLDESEDEDLKRQKRNLKERIKVRTKNILSNNITAEPIVEKPKMSLGVNVGYEMARGNTDAKLIALKYGAKVKSVRWYLCQKAKK